MERVPLTSRWATETWLPFAVVPVRDGPPGDASGHPEEVVPGSRWRFRSHVLELHPTEAEGYFLNLTAAAPCVFVMWRMDEDGAPPLARPVLVTLSYNEAARIMEGGERVDPVAMPAEIQDWMRPFVAAHYKPEPRRKNKRNDPFAGDESSRGGDGGAPR